MMKETTFTDSYIAPSTIPMKTALVRSGVALGPVGSPFQAPLPIMMEVEGLRLLSPSQIRELLSSRRSIDEVKMLIEEEANPSFVYWGDLQLGMEKFQLSDLSFRTLDTETVLRADLAEVRGGGIWSPAAKGAVAGRIETRETGVGGWKGVGSLLIREGPKRGRYRLRLEAPPEEGSP